MFHKQVTSKILVCFDLYFWSQSLTALADVDGESGETLDENVETSDACDILGDFIPEDVLVDPLDTKDAIEFKEVIEARNSDSESPSPLGSSFLNPSFPVRKKVLMFPFPLTGISPLLTR